MIWPVLFNIKVRVKNMYKKILLIGFIFISLLTFSTKIGTYAFFQTSIDWIGVDVHTSEFNPILVIEEVDGSEITQSKGGVVVAQISSEAKDTETELEYEVNIECSDFLVNNNFKLQFLDNKKSCEDRLTFTTQGDLINEEVRIYWPENQEGFVTDKKLFSVQGNLKITLRAIQK